MPRRESNSDMSHTEEMNMQRDDAWKFPDCYARLRSIYRRKPAASG